MRNCLGIEIGHYRIKIAYAENGELREFISERVEGIDRNDMRQYADLIKDLLKEYAIRCRNVVFVIRQEDAYVRRFELPLMTEEQLRLNLPYEFHDYIGNEMDKYVFDYAMIYADQEKMDLIGAACTKELSQQFEKLAKMAHLKLVGLVPAVLEEQYRTRAVQVMRVLNFYSFNNVNNTIDSLYYCGGGARYGELIDALKETLDLPVRSVAELLPEVSLDEEDEWIDSPQAYGVLLA